MRRTLAVATIVIAATLAGVPWSSGVFSAAPAPFVRSVARLDRATRELMIGNSWHHGCPVELGKLRLVRVTYWGFDGGAHRGRLVVHRRWAHEILGVFERLYDATFPIRRIRLVDRYGAEDDVSMAHDNTSAFNCRFVAGTTTWSQHAYGEAVDINPVENPYVHGSHVSPPRARRYLDRSNVRRGMIVERDVVWRAFHRIGWSWGGGWTGAKDYQHFSWAGT